MGYGRRFEAGTLFVVPMKRLTEYIRFVTSISAVWRKSGSEKQERRKDEGKRIFGVRPRNIYRISPASIVLILIFFMHPNVVRSVYSPNTHTHNHTLIYSQQTTVLSNFTIIIEFISHMRRQSEKSNFFKSTHAERNGESIYVVMKCV